MTAHYVLGQSRNDQRIRVGRTAAQGLYVRLLGSVQARLIITALVVVVMALAGCGSGGGTQAGTGSQPAGKLTEFPLPSSAAIPAAITAGPDGNLWFTDPCTPLDQTVDCSGSQIGHITPDGKVTEFPLPTTGEPGDITAGPDGNLWFTVSRVDDTSQIDRITPSGTITSFPLQRLLVYPYGITTGPDGNLWFTEYRGNKIGRITPGGQITEFPLPTAGSRPGGITTGPDKNLWFTETSNIGRITPDGQVTEFPAENAGSIATGSDGNLWFAAGTGKIGRITPGGTVTTFSLSTATSGAGGITAGPDGNVWFTACTPNEAASGGCIHNEIGRITPGGQITDFPLPVGTVPVTITTGPDKNLWFTENNSSNIGRISAGK